MFHYSIVQWLFFFYFYCFFGWCFESTYVSLKEKRFVNRGFMRGPFLPLYGSGAIMMLVVSKPFEGNLFLVYLAGCVGATALEYVTGVTMEALFKVRYWDYSYKKIQFQGHICLSSTLAWGALTILMTEVLHKVVETAVFSISATVLTIVTYLLTALLFGDFAWSFKEAMDLRDVLVKLEASKQELARLQKRLDVVIALTNEEVNARLSEFVEKTEEIASTVGNAKNQLVGTVESAKDQMVGSVENVKEQLLDQMKQGMSDWEAKTALLAEHMENNMKRIFKVNPSLTSKRFHDLIEDFQKKITGLTGEE